MLVSILGLFLLLATTADAAPAAWVVDPQAASQSVAAALLVIPDRGRELDINAVAAGQYDADALSFKQLPPNLGYPHHAYWVRMRLINPSERRLDRLLVLQRGAGLAQTLRINHLRIDSAGIERTHRLRTEWLGRGGDRIGDVRSRHQALRLALPPRATIEISARIESRVSLVLDYRLLTETELFGSDAVDYGFFGILVGTVLSIGTFALALWLGMRERIFLWFTGFAFGILFYQVHAEGYVYLVMGPQWQVPGSYLGTYIGTLHSMALLMMVRDFTTTPSSVARLDRWMVRPLLVLMSLTFPLFLVRPWLGNTAGAVGSLSAGLAMLVLTLAQLFRGRIAFRGFVFALLLYWLAGIVYLLKRIGTSPDLPIFTIGQELTTVIAVTMFAIAISQRVQAIARQNREDQERYAHQLETEVAERTQQYRNATADAETATKQVNETLVHLRAAQQQLVEQEKMASLGSLVAGVAHEVNTPLGVALTASSYLGLKSHEVATQFHAGDLRKSQLQSFIGTAEESSNLIERNLERAAHLIQSFKQVSVDRTSDGRRRFELRGYLEELVESLELKWKQRPISLAVDCPDSLHMDSFPGALGQVLTNLIQNALLHAFDLEQAGEMQITVRRRDDTRLEILFGDNGKGASAEVIAKIFEPFFTTLRGQGGTGLGLHIAFNLVTQKLGGAISVEGQPGAGLRFRLNLPLTAPEGSAG